MKRLPLVLLIFSSPVITETNLDKTFLDIAMSFRTFRMFDSPAILKVVEDDCIINKLKENKLSKTNTINGQKTIGLDKKESWDNF